ncbi:uncharacterized protein [Paramormyrops kingsleyae]|uniref:uncharacterized protein n=1 Tax=Paramormyrops kingsleyae TaxID=1676925 RepID=UPI003B974475
MDNLQQVRDLVMAALPGLSEETLAALIEGLQMLGVESKRDLFLVREEDLADYLRPIQCRRLMSLFFLFCIFFLSDHDRTEPGPLSSFSSSPCSSDSLKMSSPSLLSTPWPSNFRVKWDRMPAGIQTAVASLRRPSPADRRQMVRCVVDQMREHNINPSREICHTVAKSIIREYPRSFLDVLEDGEIIGDGCSSLLMQIKTRVEHVNRHNPLARRRQMKKSCSEAEVDKNWPKGPLDQYGCVRWQPEDFPSGETDESLEELRRQMVTLYSREGKAGAERGELQTWLEKIFVLQRRYINGTPSPGIPDVKDRWPFLFSQRGIHTHFHLLTNMPILQKLPEAIEKKGKTILKFFQMQKSNTEVTEVLSAFQEQAGHSKVMCITLLILAYFKEANDSIFLQADPSATAADVDRLFTLPSTPRLIVQGAGEMLKPSAWMLAVEGQVVMGPHEAIVNGIAVLFASYYNFNIQYPVEASSTLEFIQRGLVGINPEMGSKVAAGKVLSRKSGQVVKRKRVTMNPHVCTLLRKLMDCDWLEM